MKFKEFLPIGSVVQLKGAQKKLVIIGVMPVKHTPNGTDIAYNYLGVPYPEGYMNRDTGLLFNHDRIDKIVFTGYADEERNLFITTIQEIISKVEKNIG